MQSLDYDRLIDWPIPVVEQSYSERYTMLYALGLGLGSDPVDRDELAFVYEKDIKALPSMCCVLGRADMWPADPATGLDFHRLLHGEMAFETHKPLPAAADIKAEGRVAEIYDKGEIGALIWEERVITDTATGDKLATTRSAIFARGHGGFGGERGPSAEKVVPEDRAPDAVVDMPTLPQAALIYRLSGDLNALHCDPDVAAEVGFERPILHGLCTYGMAGYAILKTLCDHDTARLTGMTARFTAPVYPGETIRTEIWRDVGEGRAAFRATGLESDTVVLDQGTAAVA
jgi:acyl dehydratase